MVGTLDSILNVAIPLLIVTGMLFLVYKAAKEPIDKLFAWIKGLIQGGTEKTQEMQIPVYNEIVYGN